MANIQLKTIKFPGLDDTYTVPQVDNTLSVTGAAADAKKTGDELTELNERMDTEGLSDDIKEALLACLENVAWATSDGKKYYDNLEAALYEEPPAPVDPGRVFLYRFNDSLLSAGNCDFGLSAPAPTYISGKYGDCIQVVGGTADSAPRAYNIPAESMPRFDSDFTISCWFRANVDTISPAHTCFRFAINRDDDNYPNSITELSDLECFNSYETINTQGTINGRYVGIALSYTIQSYNQFTPYLSFWNSDGTKVYLFILKNDTYKILQKTWTHIAFCRKNNICTIYVDGRRACVFTYTGSLYTPNQIFFGCSISRDVPAVVSVPAGVKADIDEFYINDRECIYNGEFTPDAISL